MKRCFRHIGVFSYDSRFGFGYITWKNSQKYQLYQVKGSLFEVPDNNFLQDTKKDSNGDFFNLYHSLGIFSRRQNDVIFLIFPRKQDLTFHANCLLRRQFA